MHLGQACRAQSPQSRQAPLPHSSWEPPTPPPGGCGRCLGASPAPTPAHPLSQRPLLPLRTGERRLCGPEGTATCPALPSAASITGRGQKTRQESDAARGCGGQGGHPCSGQNLWDLGLPGSPCPALPDRWRCPLDRRQVLATKDSWCFPAMSSFLAAALYRTQPLPAGHLLPERHEEPGPLGLPCPWSVGPPAAGSLAVRRAAATLHAPGQRPWPLRTRHLPRCPRFPEFLGGLHLQPWDQNFQKRCHTLPGAGNTGCPRDKAGGGWAAGAPRHPGGNSRELMDSAGGPGTCSVREKPAEAKAY